MRQKLPESAGYPLAVRDIGRTVYPGEEFDAPSLVPGCEELDATPPDPEAPDSAEGGRKAARKGTTP